MRKPELADEARSCKILGGDDTPIHKSTLYRGIKSGRYPPPLKIGPGINRWRVDELIAVLDKATAERNK